MNNIISPVHTPLPSDIAGYEGKELGQSVINSGPYQPNVIGNQHTITWINGNRPIRVTASKIHVLADYGCVADMWAEVRLRMNGSLIDKRVWDRYANPSDTHGQWEYMDDIIPQQARVDFIFFADPIGMVDHTLRRGIYEDLNLTMAVHFGWDIKFSYDLELQ